MRAHARPGATSRPGEYVNDKGRMDSIHQAPGGSRRQLCVYDDQVPILADCRLLDDVEPIAPGQSCAVPLHMQSMC